MVYNFLCDGMGGVNWAGLELVTGMLGIEDIEPLMWRLLTIKMHQPPKDDSEASA